MIRLPFAVSLATLALALASTNPSGAAQHLVLTMPPDAPATPLSALAARGCATADLRLATTGDDGAYDGMSHSGVRAILTNVSPTPCSIARVPTFRFFAAHERYLADVTASVPVHRGMHPGPVVVPFPLQPGARAQATLRWVSSDVYDGHHCETTATLGYFFGTRLANATGGSLGRTGANDPLPLLSPVATLLCGQAAPASITFEVTNWTAVAPSASAAPVASVAPVASPSPAR